MIGYLGRKFAAGRRGQGMTEYIIIVALVAIALITIVTLFGNKIKFLFTGATQSLEEGKVIDPQAVQNTNSLKAKLGADQVKWDTQKKGHTLQKYKSGD